MENVLRFEHPDYLYWLIVIPVLVIIYILFRIGQKRRFERFAKIEMRNELVPSFSTRRANFKFVISFLSSLARFWLWPTCRAAARWRR